MLKKGDAVVHPSHGAGVLADTAIWQVSGVERRYHRIELVSGRGTLFIPIDQVNEAGLLPVPGNDELIISVLSDQPQELADDYQKRKANLAAKVHSGNIAQVAEALRDLAWRERETKLSDGDSHLKSEAQELLAGVLSLQLNLDIDAATRHLNLATDQAIKEWLSEDDAA